MPSLSTPVVHTAPIILLSLPSPIVPSKFVGKDINTGTKFWRGSHESVHQFRHQKSLELMGLNFVYTGFTALRKTARHTHARRGPNMPSWFLVSMLPSWRIGFS